MRIVPRLHTLFEISYTPGLHIPFCKPSGWINVFNFLDRAFFDGCVAAFQNDVDKHSPHIKKIGHFGYSSCPPMLISPATSVRKAGCAHRAQSQPLDVSLIVLLESQRYLPSSSPFPPSHHFPRTSNSTPSCLELLIQQTYTCPMRQVNVVGTNLVSRSVRPGLESQLYSLSAD